MSVSFDVHGVARVEARAYSASLVTLGGAPRMYCQTLFLWDADNRCIGRIVLFLDNPKGALPIGDCSQLDGVVLEVEALSGLAEPSMA